MPFLRRALVALAGLWALSASFAAAQEFDNVSFGNFQPTGSPGACGVTFSAGQAVVAIPSAQFAGGANCQRVVTLTSGSVSAQAAVLDECTGCDANTILLTDGVFAEFADTSLVGSWTFA